VIAGIAERGNSLSGLRPFNALSDLKPVAELIELAFGDALDPSSREMLREMRALAWLLGPAFWLFDALRSPLADLFGGFVWVEEGSIVGNVTVHLQRGSRQGWFISNLAVHPEHRRKGVARRLLMAGLESARSKGAPRISLEVRADNVPARRLYSALGFRQVDSTTTMRMRLLHTIAPVRAAGYSVEVVPADGGKELFLFAEETLSPEAGEILPLLEKDYWQSPARQVIGGIGDLLRGRFTYRLAARREGELAGLVLLRTGSFGLPHSLTLVVHPEHRTQVEEPLLTKALSILEAVSAHTLHAKIRPSYGYAVEVCKRLGFTEKETLDLWTLEREHQQEEQE
jgi:ribosomal protein S18 acetylase RimI-like enzyme